MTFCPSRFGVDGWCRDDRHIVCWGWPFDYGVFLGETIAVDEFNISDFFAGYVNFLFLLVDIGEFH